MATSRKAKMDEIFNDGDFDLEEPVPGSELFRDESTVQKELKNGKASKALPKSARVIEPAEQKKEAEPRLAKYETLTKMAIRIEDDHRYALDKVATAITRKRSGRKGQERITANSVARAILTIFAKHGDRIISEADLDNIETDDEIAKRLELYFSGRGLK